MPGMFKGLNREIEQLSRDKGIRKDVIIEAVKNAFLSAARKRFGPDKEIEAHFNEQEEEIELFEFLNVVNELKDPLHEIEYTRAKEHDPECQIGDVIGLKMDSDELGRIAAQAAKQVIIQKLRDAESEIIHTEYKDRKGTLIAGIVRRFEKGAIMIDLGRTEAVLPVSEQVPREHYRAGDRIQTYVLDVVRGMRGAEIVVSRAHTGLLVKLFENEVPEIYERIVKIESAAREPGGRSKIAVSSKDSDVDPVGACVGMKGSRVQAVVQELRGEKIDIVAWHPDPARYICNAIAPAEVSRVIMDEKNRTMELIVADDQLSLAIGKKGQNVRLAARLTGWKIDIHSESKMKKLAEEGIQKLKQVEGIGDNLAELIFNQGITTPEALAGHETQQIAQITGLDVEKINALKASASEWVKLNADQKPAAGPSNAASPETTNGSGPTEHETVQVVVGEEEKELLRIKGIGVKTIDQLRKGGFLTVALLAGSEPAAVAEKTGLSEKKSRELVESARSYQAGDVADQTREDDD